MHQPSEGSGTATKHWMVKDWNVLLFIVPEMVVAPGKGVVELFMAEAITAKFWRLLAPVSRSLVSLAVTPKVFSVPPARSIPRPVFEKMELPRTLLPVAPWRRAQRRS